MASGFDYVKEKQVAANAKKFDRRRWEEAEKERPLGSEATRLRRVIVVSKLKGEHAKFNGVYKLDTQQDR